MSQEKRINKMLEDYNDFLPEEKIIFIQLLEDLLKFNIKNKTEKVPYSIKRFKNSPEFNKQLKIFYKLAVKEFGEKAVAGRIKNFYTSLQRVYFHNNIYGDNIIVSNVPTKRIRGFDEETQKLIDNKELNIPQIGIIRKSQINALRDYNLIEISLEKYPSNNMYKLAKSAEESQRKDILERLIYELFKWIKKEFGEHDFKKGLEEIKGVEDKQDLCRYDKGTIKQLYNQIKFSGIQLSFESNTGKILNCGKNIHTFKDINNNRAITANILFKSEILGKTTFKDILSGLDKTYQGQTIKKEDDKMIRKAVKDINNIIKTKTEGKIEETFSIGNDGKDSYYIRQF